MTFLCSSAVCVLNHLAARNMAILDEVQDTCTLASLATACTVTAKCLAIKCIWLERELPYPHLAASCQLSDG